MTRARTLPILVVLGLVGLVTIATGGAFATTATSARSVNVSVKDDFFQPSRLSVTAGTRVRWIWRGADRHNVVVDSGPTRFRSPTQRSGSFARTLRRRGTYRLLCTRHAGMGMRVTVRKR